MRWFKHQSDARNSLKLRKVRRKYGADGYAIYWFCLEAIAYDVDKDNLTFDLKEDAETIAFELNIQEKRVEEIMFYMVETGLFECSQDTITCLKLAESIDKSMTNSPKMRAWIGKQSVMTQPDNVKTCPELEVELEKEKELKDMCDSRFDEFWDLYAKKVDTKKCRAKFEKLSKKTVDKIFDVLPDYIKSTPDKKYRKLPATWLNGECWNDEIEIPLDLNNYDYIIELFNNAMSAHGEVPQAVMMDEQRIKNLEFLFSNTDLNPDNVSNYFEHCSSSESFRWYRERNQFDLTWYLSADAYKIAKERK